MSVFLLCPSFAARAQVAPQDYVAKTPHDILVALFLKQNQIRDVYAWEKWLNNNMVYVRDMVDIWNDPSTTIRNRYGDCEDYAILNRSVLRVLGNEAELFLVDTRHGCHAICLFRYKIGEEHYYGYFDNSKIKITMAQRFSEVAELLRNTNGYRNLRKYVQEDSE